MSIDRWIAKTGAAKRIVLVSMHQRKNEVWLTVAEELGELLKTLSNGIGMAQSPPARSQLHGRSP
jgi:hypothetical protein